MLVIPEAAQRLSGIAKNAVLLPFVRFVRFVVSASATL